MLISLNIMAVYGFANLARLEGISGDAVYPTGPQLLYQCKNPHEPGANLLDVIYDFPKALNPEQLKQVWRKRRMSNNPLDASGVWRFRELLPFVENPNDEVTVGEGNTRLLEGFESARN